MNPNQEDGREDVRYDLGITVHSARNLSNWETRLIFQKACTVGITIVMSIGMLLFALAAFYIIPMWVPLVYVTLCACCAAVRYFDTENPKEL